MSKIFNEKFEAVGYDESGWAEEIGGGCVCDEDYAVSGVTGEPTNWGFKCLRIYKALAADVYTWKMLSANQPIAYYRIACILQDITGIVNGERTILLQINDDAGSPALILCLVMTGGVQRFQLMSYHDGTPNGYLNFTNLAIDTHYLIQLKWDATNDVWAWKVNDIPQRNNIDSTHPVESEGTLTGTHVTHCRTHSLGVLRDLGDFTLNMFYDNFAIDDATWPDTANVWEGKIIGVTNPAKIMGINKVWVKEVMGV